MKNKKYLLNAGFLILIPNIFNLAFYKYLPKEYSADIFSIGVHEIILIGEFIGRIGVFCLPFFFMFSLNKRNVIGNVLYLLGMIVYFISWLMLIFLPETVWSRSIFGFTAPSYTPIIWLIGMAHLINDSYIKRVSYRPIYFIIISIIFILFHFSHALRVYQINY